MMVRVSAMVSITFHTLPYLGCADQALFLGLMSLSSSQIRVLL